MSANFFTLLSLFTCVILTVSSAQSDTNICKEEFDDTIFLNPEIPPIFDNDTCNLDNKLMKYIYTNLRIKTPLSDSIALEMIVAQFTVTKEGEVKDVCFRRGVRLAEQTNIQDILSNMPIWTPGRMGDAIIDMKVTMPIRLENERE